MWLGARRAGHALLSALAYPAMGLLLLTLLLAYSRGALVALAIGLVAWFCVVPLRLRGAAVLRQRARSPRARVAAWTSPRTRSAPKTCRSPTQASAGHQLGALRAGDAGRCSRSSASASASRRARRAPGPRLRRRAGAALIALVVLAVLGFAGALAHSHRGFTGSISHAVHSLTDPNAKPPPNTPGRLTAVASVRARYWKEALKVF